MSIDGDKNGDGKSLILIGLLRVNSLSLFYKQA
jgi:hypothetical protein